MAASPWQNHDLEEIYPLVTQKTLVVIEKQ